MRRTRLDTTAYGEVPPPDTAEIAAPPQPSVANGTGKDDRWVIRRTALSRQLVLDAQALFQERLRRPVSENEARNLLGNLGDYMWMLVRWEVSSPVPEPTAIERRPRGRPRKDRGPGVQRVPRGKPCKNPPPGSH